jgi:dihydrofolate reductase
VHFVRDGLESAVQQAKVAAGGKSVGVHGANTIQQLLNAGLLDEMSIDIVAGLLGSGIRNRRAPGRRRRAISLG